MAECDGCYGGVGTEDSHPCPCLQAHDDHSDYCNCCPDCVNDCTEEANERRG